MAVPLKVKNIFVSFLSPVFQQLFNVCIFLLFSRYYFNSSLGNLDILVALATGLITESFFIYIGVNKRSLNYSSLIAPLATCVITLSYSPYILATVVSLSLLPKIFLRHKDGGHFYNPSNVAALLGILFFREKLSLTSSLWVASNYFLPVQLFLGITLLIRVKLFGNALIYFFSIAILRYLFVVNDVSLVLREGLSHFSLFYTFFVINDPATIPTNKIQKMLYPLTVAVFQIYLFTYLGNQQIIPPLALVLTSSLFFLRDKFKVMFFVRTALLLIFGLFVLYFSEFNRARNIIKTIVHNSESFHENEVNINQVRTDYSETPSTISVEKNDDQILAMRIQQKIKGVLFKEHKNAFTGKKIFLLILWE